MDQEIELEIQPYVTEAEIEARKRTTDYLEATHQLQEGTLSSI